jgi:predicted esterase
MSNKHYIAVEKTAVYHTLGNPKTANKVWFVLHGYGMLSAYFINKFQAIVDDNTAVIAPEGLSKLYTKGFYGRVGSSWMTKEDREVEIKDYINYLNQLYNTIIKDNASNTLTVNLLGFSQGGATVGRWAADGKIEFDNLILWASAFPEDIDFTKISNHNTFLLYGDDDEFASDKSILKQKELLEKINLNCTLIHFVGKHDIPENVLLEQSKLNNW